MFELIKLLFDICLFSKGPQDIPCSVWLLRFLFAVDVAVSFLMIKLHAPLVSAMLQAIAGALLIIAFSRLALYFVRRPVRFTQTATALLGADAIISFIALPAMASMTIGKGAVLAFLITIGLIVWHWAVTGHIIRHALQQSLPFSLGIAFLYLLASYQVMALLNNL